MDKYYSFLLKNIFAANISLWLWLEQTVFLPQPNLFHFKKKFANFCFMGTNSFSPYLFLTWLSILFVSFPLYFSSRFLEILSQSFLHLQFVLSAQMVLLLSPQNIFLFLTVKCFKGCLGLHNLGAKDSIEMMMKEIILPKTKKCWQEAFQLVHLLEVFRPK